MPGPASAGLLVYALDLGRLAAYYESLLGMTRLHASDELVVLESAQIQLVVHAMPAAIASTIVVTRAPQRRDQTALKFFFTVDSLDAAQASALALGGEVFAQTWVGPGFIVRNAMDPEGNVFQLRQRTS
jgi:predicted enzyme related to lactoylglutathione lyase